MNFWAKFGWTATVVLGLPFFVILLLGKSGSEGCISHVADNVPSTFVGNFTGVDRAEKEQCNPAAGKFGLATRIYDWLANHPELYVFGGLVIAFFIACAWQMADYS